jgi:hypothetical protein
MDEMFHRSPCRICGYLCAILRKQVIAPLARHDDNRASQEVGCWIRTYITDPTEILVIYDGVARFSCQLIVDMPWEQRVERDTFLQHRLRTWSYYGDGSVVNPQWVSGFIDSCCNTHSVHDRANGCGSNSIRSPNTKPVKLILIDVKKLCLVEVDTTLRYCSLSYVWGGAKVLRTTNENRKILMRTWAFQKFCPAPVVQDAIRLTRSIGIRYLWVDGLCIPQDDGVLTAFYIGHMDYIYSQSILTIVAASSTSAMDRLPGVVQGSRAPQHTPKIGSMRVVRKTQELDVHLDDAMYEARAWSKC